jgi:Na+(H+)/acetate symporter ActP
VLLASATQVSHNIVMRLRPAASERVEVLSARVTVVALTAIYFERRHVGPCQAT